MGSPFGPLVLIANPRSGNGQVGRELPEVERQLRALKLDYRIVETDRRGHAIDLAREALDDGERFLVAVVMRAERLPRGMGKSRYFFGFWLSIGKYRPTEVTVRADRKEFSGRANNVVVANCQFFGGGMKISPRSYPGDGLLDVQITTGPKSEAFTLLPKVYRGEHVPHPHIKEMRGKVIQVDGERPLPIEGDGEVLGTTPATFTVLPHVLRLKI